MPDSTAGELGDLVERAGAAQHLDAAKAVGQLPGGEGGPPGIGRRMDSGGSFGPLSSAGRCSGASTEKPASNQRRAIAAYRSADGISTSIMHRSVRCAAKRASRTVSLTLCSSRFNGRAMRDHARDWLRASRSSR